MNLEDEFSIIRRVPRDPFPPTDPLKEIELSVESVIRHLDTCITLEEYYVLETDGWTRLFFGWREMDIVEYAVFSHEDARKIVSTVFPRKDKKC